MKKFILLISLVTLFSCKAQSPIVPLYQQGLGFTANTYYKDIDNDFNKFVGTWKYETSNSTIIIQLQKRTMHYDATNNIYYDMLVGEYQYIVNGVTIVNTLSNLSNTNLHLYDNAISGWLITRPCSNCPTTQRGVILNFSEPNRSHLNRKLELRHFVELGLNFIKLKHYSSGPSQILPTDPPNPPTNSLMPLGDYIFEKIN